MTYLICYVIAFLACTIGTICGMGGGIIIKPTLDMTGVMRVSTITFLSGCTVIAMTCWAVGKTLINKESAIDLKNTTILAVSAAVGGLLGKQMYTIVAAQFENPDTSGGVQACLLLAATIATFVYTINKQGIRSRQTENILVIIIIGLVLGMLGSFLGIGGGPFNVAALYYFFDMKAKKAAQNSLYIVLFSQLTSTVKSVVSNGLPEFSIWILVGMVVLGILGSEVGRRLNKKLNDHQATHCLEGIMVVIMLINIYNIIKFFLL